MTVPSSEDEFTIDKALLEDLGEQVIMAVQSCDNKELLEKTLEGISK